MASLGRDLSSKAAARPRFEAGRPSTALEMGALGWYTSGPRPGEPVPAPGAYVDRKADDATQHSGTTAIVGRPNVGKSTFLNAALGQAISIVSAVPQTTRHGVLGVLHRAGSEIILIDTPGMTTPRSRLGRALNRMARGASEQADLVVFMTEVAKPASSGRSGPRGTDLVHPGDRTLLADLGAAVPTILVLNKVDLVHDKSRLLPLMEELSKIRQFAAIVPISALKGDGVEVVLDEVASRLPERPHRFEADALTDMPSKFFAGEFIREQILLVARKEVPHAAAVQIERFEPATGGRLVRIDARILVEREGQKKILIGKGGSMLKAIGTQARARIEELLDVRVHLSLWVQVSPGWTESPQALAELGYEDPR